jgi:hypothetical protein
LCEPQPVGFRELCQAAREELGVRADVALAVREFVRELAEFGDAVFLLYVGLEEVAIAFSQREAKAIFRAEDGAAFLVDRACPVLGVFARRIL